MRVYTMPNLAHELPPPQGQVVQFPKKERPVMSEKDEGYTKLANSLIDDQIMAQLNDKAFKCLMFIMRQTVGFDRLSHTIAITQFQKYCGIKKRDTVISCIKSLEDLNLIKVDRRNGALNEYFYLVNQSHETGLPLKDTSPMKGDGTSTTKRDYTSPTKRDTNKENLKENFKERDEEDNAQEPEKFSTQNRPLNFVEYHTDDRAPISFRDLCKKYPAQVDFQEQAKTNFPNHSPELIFETLKKMAQWSLDKSNHTPQKWMTIWLSTFMKNEKTDAEVAAAAERKAARAAKALAKPQPQSRFGQYLKPQQEMRDV